MANPQERSKEQTSAVAACLVTDCRFNENQDCHAGEIRVEVGAQGAVCATYSPETARPRP
ncbi:MAG: DUF1540 domain-containing protein [Gemmatimonadota bacterium]|jgi:hypothetical protein|nr:DUF1540 domain-containing protein [Gemmatimonadota bacterium]